MASILDPLGITALIFGGCCANVYALEAIVRVEPGSGLLITFLQFMLTTAATYFTQASFDGRLGLRPNSVPLSRWALIAAMFCAINVLNNWAFAFNISVPVHIILRSFGSVTTMGAGMLRGKSYTPVQILSVLILTVGVLVSAWADSESKGKSMSIDSETTTSQFTYGLVVLLVAQLLSAFMGAYVEETYTKYKASWTENMFYSHFMSLPFFLPFSSRLQEQFAKLASTAPLQMPQGDTTSGALTELLLWLPAPARNAAEGLPQGILALLANAMTQLVCISGVNLLSAKSSAVTVTIVLNIRKLVSFILSTLLFGHSLSPRMMLGSALVFGSGALYGWETSWRIPRRRVRDANNAKKET
ncbi:hypothetical protein AMS68_002411 [Peltaster fructicola]|uniref:Sugar phosphate transporter domain-containing protein n=1 Tax=Peltaster fructicola TaxID=286661 RepID=A0A6H0XQ84_9PEZI|nr:hypothetical protein AMS68_002411 [Peltaster fructicola]